jgi:phosphomannomutase
VVAALQASAHFPGAEIHTIDGLRADYPDGFGLVRASNTTPVLVLRFEGHTPEALQRIEHDFMAALRAVKPDAQVAQVAH